MRLRIPRLSFWRFLSAKRLGRILREQSVMTNHEESVTAEYSMQPSSSSRPERLSFVRQRLCRRPGPPASGGVDAGRRRPTGDDRSAVDEAIAD